jgi:general secretion pathway protein E
LVRTLCPDCKQPFVLRAKEMDADPRFSALGFQAGATLHRPIGCERCGNTGYRGRVAIFEVLEITETIRRHILSGANDTVIEQAARAEGMTTMVEDGLSRCHKGITTLDEVMRVAVLQ